MFELIALYALLIIALGLGLWIVSILDSINLEIKSLNARVTSFQRNQLSDEEKDSIVKAVEETAYRLKHAFPTDFELRMRSDV